jgi:hypothetical protein
MREGWSAISDIMGLGMKPQSLKRQLEAIFDRLKDLAWLRVQRRGALLLLNSKGDLVLVAQCGYDREQARNCEQVGLARCACGTVAQTGGLTHRVCDGALAKDGVSGQHYILPLNADGRMLGVAPIFLEPGHTPSEDETAFMNDLAKALAQIVSRRLIEETIQVRELELEEKQADVIRKLGTASEYRDNETGLHVMRMSHIAGAIAKALGLSVDERERLVMAAPMHDVGKIGIPDAILLKPGKLDPNEFAVMTTHSTIGGKILDGADILMQTAREIATTHHEKWDGSGYPAGLAGEAIPLSGRVCAVADVFDALLSPRAYKTPWTVEAAIAHIRDGAGKAFDPKVVAAFDAAMPEILRIRELYRENVIDPRDTLALPPLDGKPGAWVVWDQSVKVGIDVIDEHHRYLFELTNDLYEAIEQQRGSREIGRVLIPTCVDYDSLRDF